MGKSKAHKQLNKFLKVRNGHIRNMIGSVHGVGRRKADVTQAVAMANLLATVPGATAAVMERLSYELEDIVRHSLGLDYPDKCKNGPYRNYYYAETGDKRLEALEAMGLMRKGRAINEGRNTYYLVTEAGAAAVGSTLPEED